MKNFLLGLLLVFGIAEANIDVREFSDPKRQERYQSLIEELRCPKCQNQTIAESDAPLAKDLRDIVFEQVEQGASDEQVRDFMLQRYGDFILYRPPLKPTTWALWFGPLFLLLLSVIGLALWWRRQRRQTQAPLSAQEQERLQALLQNESGSAGENK